MAPEVDYVTAGLLVFSTFVMVLVFGLIAFFGIRYRAGSPYSRRIDHRGEHALEWGWTFATLGVFLLFGAWAAVVFFKTRSIPAGASEITVVGKQWMWKFQHPDGRRELNELHVPVGRPVKLMMTSQDVIHSFFVPAFRIKQDVLPDRYTELWFQATEPGTYHLFCSQYCGTFHAEMRGRIIALNPVDYQRWLEIGNASGSQGGEQPMASRGGRLFTRLGCISCHGENPGVRAPSLAGIYGKSQRLSDGTDVIADENYLRESILNPQAKIVEGYSNLMPSFAGQVSEEDLLDLIAYIKSLRATPQGEAPAGPHPSAAIPEPDEARKLPPAFGRKETGSVE